MCVCVRSCALARVHTYIKLLELMNLRRKKTHKKKQPHPRKSKNTTHKSNASWKLERTQNQTKKFDNKTTPRSDRKGSLHCVKIIITVKSCLLDISGLCVSVWVCVTKQPLMYTYALTSWCEEGCQKVLRPTKKPYNNILVILLLLD